MAEMMHWDINRVGDPFWKTSIDISFSYSASCKILRRKYQLPIGIIITVLFLYAICEFHMHFKSPSSAQCIFFLIAPIWALLRRMMYVQSANIRQFSQRWNYKLVGRPRSMIAAISNSFEANLVQNSQYTSDVGNSNARLSIHWD